MITDHGYSPAQLVRGKEAIVADIERVLSLNNFLGEGPIWNSQEHALYWVDLTPGILHRWQPVNAKLETFELSMSIGCLGLRKAGGLIMATKRGYVFWDAQKGVTPIADPIAHEPNMRFNDGKIDPAGRFFAGTMHETDTSLQAGFLYRLDADRSVHVAESGVRCPNGMGWSLDHKTMYFTDSPLRTIYAYDYDIATGAIANRRTFVTVPTNNGVPDGMTVDREGFIWSCHWDGWKITRYDAAGKVERVVPMPVARPTSCAFGGRNLDEMYVTSAGKNVSAADRPKQPFAGDLLRFHPGVKGQEEPQFAG